jgi:hypothetical protein
MSKVKKKVTLTKSIATFLGTPPVVIPKLQREDGGYLLREDGGKILRQS